MGAQEDESGSIRTKVQKSGSCEAVATGEAVDALVYLILGVAGDGILYLTVDASGTIGTNGAANQYTSLNVTLWADPRNDAGSPSATEADGATFSNGMANDIVLATGTLVSASMSIDPTTMTRSAYLRGKHDAHAGRDAPSRRLYRVRKPTGRAADYAC